MAKYRTGGLALLILLFLAVAWPVLAQGPTLNIEELQLDESTYPNMSAVVSVVNQSGVPISGLSAENFDILEDGQPIEITGVSASANADKPIAIALVLDLSGSAPLPDVQIAANQFLDSLGPNDSVALIGFNEHMASLDDVDPFKEVNFTTDKNNIRNTIDGWREEIIVPKSAVYEAAYKGVLFTAQQVANRRAVIVLTDGADTELGNNCATYSRPEVATSDSSKAAARDKRVPVFTVGIYNPDPTFCQNRAYLQSLSSETGGEYQEAADATELGALFVQVGERLRQQYQLSFETDLKRDGKNHVLSIRATTAEGQGVVERTLAYPAPPSIPLIERLQWDINGELQDLSPTTELRGIELIVPEISAQNNIAQVEYYVNDELVERILVDRVNQFTHHPWEWKWNTASRDVGDYQLKVLAFDDTAKKDDPSTASAPFIQAVKIAECNFICQIEQATGLDALTLLIIAIIVVLVLGLIFYLISRKAKQDSEPAYATPAYDPPTEAGFVPPPATPGAGPYGPAPGAAPTAPPDAPPLNPTVNMAESAYSNPAGGQGEAPPDKTMILRKKPGAFGMLVMTNGRHAGQQFRLEDGATIGRANGNLIVLDDGAVSSHHAKIRLDGKTFTIQDLGSTNGTMVNGAEIVRHNLADGDEIEIGESKFTFKQVETG